MVVLNALLNMLNAVIDWMVGLGLNDYTAVTLLVVVPSAVYAKASEAWEKHKEKKAAASKQR